MGMETEVCAFYSVHRPDLKIGGMDSEGSDSPSKLINLDMFSSGNIDTAI